jgi:hypothetical protein
VGSVTTRCWGENQKLTEREHSGNVKTVLWGHPAGLRGGVMTDSFQVTITEQRLGDIRHGPPTTFAEALQYAHHLKILFPTQRVFILNGSKEIVYDLK